MKKILICGANGFIGKNILERFYNNENFDIRATYYTSHPDDRYDVEWIKADLRNVDDVKKVMVGIDVVLQYAATTTGSKDIVSKPYIHVTDNVVMNSLLMREAFEQNIEHFIMPSCTIMYSSSDDIINENDFDENKGVNRTYFGAGNTKVYLEKMCKFYSSLSNTKYTVLRQSNIYGYYDDYGLDKSHVFGATIQKVMTNNNKITVWGTGEEERDFLFVSDLVDLIEDSIENQKTAFELVNASLGNSTSISDLVKEVVELSGLDLLIEYDSSKPTIKTKLAIDNKKAEKVFGWIPKHSLEEGITKTLKWYRENETIKLNEDDIKFYEDKGYFAVSNIISQQDREVFKEYMRRHANKDFASLMNPDRPDEMIEQEEREMTSDIKSECIDSSRIARNVMKNPNVVSIMNQLQRGREFVGISSQYLFKEPGTKYANQAWSRHQDNYWRSNKNGSYFTFNWYLDRTDIDNGCVYVYEGSHKAGLLPAPYVMSYREEADENGITHPGPKVDVPDEYVDKKINIEFDENCFVFFHGNLIHGTHANITKNRPRPWYSCCYISKGEEYFEGEYSKRIEVELI